MITIVDYGAGNVFSVQKAFDRIGFKTSIAERPEQLSGASGLVLPGVGHFASAMKSLASMDLIGRLSELVINQSRPILGICLGMQLFMEHSDEGNVAGLGWIPGRCHRINGGDMRVPHIGLNSINHSKTSILSAIDEDARFYFVHSYVVQPSDRDSILATTSYSEEFCSALKSKNIYGVQFHPEKSHAPGLQILRNFGEIVQKT